MNKNTKSWIKIYNKWIILIFVFLAPFFIFELVFLNRFYPAIFIAGINVSGLTNIQADKKIQETIYTRASNGVDFQYKEEIYSIKVDKILIQDQTTLDQAYSYGRSRLYYKPQNLKVDVSFGSLDTQLESIAKTVNQDPIEAQVVVRDEEISVTPSQMGFALDQKELKKRLISYLNGEKINTTLPTKVVLPKLSYKSALKIKKILDWIKINPLVLTYEHQSWTLDLNKLASLIDLTSGTNLSLDYSSNLVSAEVSKLKLGLQFKFDDKKLTEYLDTIAKQINQDVKEPLFSFDGQKVSEFEAGHQGKKLSVATSSQLITKALASQNSNEINLPVDIIEPKNKLTNDLGIKELLGRGISNFTGSIANRIFNIGLTASKINGVLVAPGEVFSFNNTVGDISAASGFKQAYIIKSGRTVLDDGGGVCQDSTTLFRAVLNAGLPIVARTAHAYRVGYYEQGPAPGGAGQGFPPGLDATIFSPSVDFRFKNDTPAHILIQAYIVGNSIYVDLYGSSDNRVSQISTPVVTDSTPPPPPLYQDDPTLPKGETKQVDWPAYGANVSFTRTVTRNSEVLIKETFKSNYRPWQAVYLVGTK